MQRRAIREQARFMARIDQRATQRGQGTRIAFCPVRRYGKFHAFAAGPLIAGRAIEHKRIRRILMHTVHSFREYRA